MTEREGKLEEKEVDSYTLIRSERMSERSRNVPFSFQLHAATEIYRRKVVDGVCLCFVSVGQLRALFCVTETSQRETYRREKQSN